MCTLACRQCAVARGVPIHWFKQRAQGHVAKRGQTHEAVPWRRGRHYVGQGRGDELCSACGVRPGRGSTHGHQPATIGRQQASEPQQALFQHPLPLAPLWPTAHPPGCNEQPLDAEGASPTQPARQPATYLTPGTWPCPTEPPPPRGAWPPAPPASRHVPVSSRQMCHSP
jgi:hypothetical protein